MSLRILVLKEIFPYLNIVHDPISLKKGRKIFEGGNELSEKSGLYPPEGGLGLKKIILKSGSYTFVIK